MTDKLDHDAFRPELVLKYADWIYQATFVPNLEGQHGPHLRAVMTMTMRMSAEVDGVELNYTERMTAAIEAAKRAEAEIKAKKPKPNEWPFGINCLR